MLARSWDRNSVCLSVCPSVCPSVTRVLCDEKKEHTADVLISHERVIILVFLTPAEIGGRCPLPPEICALSDSPPLENADFDQYRFFICSLP